MNQHLVKLSDLFNVYYGINLELNKMEICEKEDPEGINFVSRSEKNNGISARVKKVAGIDPNPAETISVAGGGSVLASFVQPEPYYSGRDLYFLSSKKKMTEAEMLFYCYCIRQNRYKYSYGRQANKTLRDIMLPAAAPKWLSQLKAYEIPSSNPIHNKQIPLNILTWKWFKLSELFEIERGRGPRLKDLEINGTIPFVTSSDQNNGWSGYTDNDPFHNGNVISVSRNGSVGEAFYQPTDFCSTEDVHIFNPKFDLNKFTALFICTIIRMEKYRYNYGRKWGLQRMNETMIKLPASGTKPDFNYMENYIKTLPFSGLI